MLWLDLIDILFVLVGFIVGYIFCCLINRDAMDDECESCLYREYVMEVLENEQEKSVGLSTK